MQSSAKTIACPSQQWDKPQQLLKKCFVILRNFGPRTKPLEASQDTKLSSLNTKQEGIR